MKLLISGASGFLGSNILKYVTDFNTSIEVVALSTNADSINQQFSEFDNITAYSYEDMDNIHHDDIDVFINLAYPRNDCSEKLGASMSSIYNNLRTIASWNIPAIINVSSQSVYGTSRTGMVKESDDVNLDSIYATGKYCFELICDSLFHDSRLIHVRLASLIGCGFDQRVTNKLVDIAIKNKAMQIKDNGTIYSYLDVRDAVEGLLSISARMENPLFDCPRIINLGTESGYTLTDISSIIHKILLESYDMYTDVSFVDCEMTNKFTFQLDSTLLKQCFNWIPSITIEDSLKRIIEYKMQGAIHE